MQKSYQMKNYDKSLFNLKKPADQYHKLLNWYNFIYLTNKKDLNIRIKLNKWWYAKKIKLLKVKMSFAQTRLYLAEQRKIYFKILSLYLIMII